METEAREGKEITRGKFVNVSFRYPDAAMDVLHDVTFTVRRGERLAVLGDNGAGKSTLLRPPIGANEPGKAGIR